MIARYAAYHRDYGYMPGHKAIGDVRWKATIFRNCVALAVVFGIYATAAGIYRSFVHDKYTNYYTSDYMAAVGLDVSRWNHLKLGAAIGGGTVGNISSSAHFFLFGGNVSTTGQFTPSSVVRLGFKGKEASYILEIPYTKVRFIPTPGTKAAVKFIVSNLYLDYDERFAIGGDYWTFQPRHLSETPPSIYNTTYWRGLNYLGFPTFLAEHLIRVEFRLTPAQYDAYLGSLQRTSK